MNIDPNLPGSPSTFSELVEYAAGSIVSKQIIKQAAGSVTIFSFDKDQSLSEHTASSDALACVVDGRAEFMVGPKKFSVRKDEFVLLPANIPHAVNATERFKMVLIMIKT